jgi:hypothetical protein
VPINATLLAALEEARGEALAGMSSPFAAARSAHPRKASRPRPSAPAFPDITRMCCAIRWPPGWTMAGIELRARRRVLGHADSRTTERVYVKRRHELLRDAVEVLA